MDAARKKSIQRKIDPADEWLKNEGYYRKTSPKEPTCLFRAVSEQIYMTQVRHTKVRKECVEFMRKNKELFEKDLAVPLENYLNQMSCFTEWGGMNEIKAMSRLYKRDFIIYYCQKMIKENVTNNNYDNYIYLCHTSPQQYETIYDKNFIRTAAYCQSIVYQTLYKDVFKMSDVDDIIQNMLHDRSGNIRHNKFFLKGNISLRERLKTELQNKIDNDSEEISKTIAPFPYRVAKSLDPNIYRNTDFDTWQELKREASKGIWLRWNDAELQVGGKCFVKMDREEKNNIDKSNNNLQYISNEQNNDKNGNVTSANNIDKTMEDSTSQLFIGHIQEMSKDEGPVVVFIEELGEKKIVPYASLKPLCEQRNLTSPPSSGVSPILLRKNSSFDHIAKWRRTWNSNTRKTKDSVNSAVFRNLDRINNNRSNINSSNNNKKNITNQNTNWSGNSSVKTDSTPLENYTSIENFSPKQEYSMDNTVEVRPLSIVLDNPQPLMKPTGDSNKEESRKKLSPSFNNQNQSESYDQPLNSNNNNFTTENGNVQSPQHSSSGLSTPNDNFYSPHSNGPPSAIYPGNLNVVCVPTDGNMYVTSPFYGDRANQIVNLAIRSSTDTNGSDLPYADIPTLRFFFNLGVDCFHNNHMWTTNPPVTFANYVPPNSTLLPLPLNEVQSSNENPQQSLNNQPNNSRPLPQQNRRKNEQPFNSNRSNTHSYGPSAKSTHTRIDTRQDLAKTKNDSHHSSHDFQKTKSMNSNNENNYDNGNWELRKNNTAGRYKKNNEGRNRNERPPQYHGDYQQRSYNNRKDNGNSNNVNQINNSFGKSESQNFQKTKNDGGQKQPMNPPPQPTPIPASSPPFHQHINHPSAAMYTNVPYYTNEMENFYPHNANIYSIPYVAHQEANDGINNQNTYIYTGPENYPPSMTPIYTPITYPPPPIYSTVPSTNPHENWYTIPGGQPHYLPYQFSVSQQQQQPPPTINSGVQSPNN